MSITVTQIIPKVLSTVATQNEQDEIDVIDEPINTYRLLYAIDGVFDVIWEEKLFHVVEKNAFLFLPGYSYTVQTYQEPVRLLDVRFILVFPEVSEQKYLRKGQRLPLRFSDYPLLNAPLVMTPAIQTRRILTEFLWEQQKQLQFCQELSDLYLRIIFLALTRDTAKTDDANISDAAAKIMRYVRMHITENIQNETAARDLSYHSNYINRVIKSATGMTFHKYVVDEKLQHASTLLVSSDDSITSIAYSLSFNTSSHFSNLFAEKYNCTPSQYRKRYAK